MTNDKTKPCNPLERIIYDALDCEVIVDGTLGKHGATKHLDFYCPDADVYIEVSAAYTPRKIKQLSRADNVIYIQGKKACQFFADTRVDRPDPELAEVRKKLESVGICIDIETVHKAIDEALAILDRKIGGA